MMTKKQSTHGLRCDIQLAWKCLFTPTAGDVDP